jgi:glycosyltransferase involved in cell wall biosynthesis
MAQGAPRISLVIPAYNEAALLPRLLDSVDEARRRFRHGAEAVEVIVTDNASTDATAEIARARGCRVARAEKRRIAAARNAGAAAARGGILCFTDADGRIHPETFNTVEDAMADGRFAGGATGVTMERWSPGIFLTYLFFLPLVWFWNIDTGVVFCRREDFERTGGYDERRLYAEDVAFMMALRRLARKRGQRLVRLRRAKGMASARKFDERGDWHYFPLLLKAVPMLLSPARRHAFAEDYWYRGRENSGGAGTAEKREAPPR